MDSRGEILEKTTAEISPPPPKPQEGEQIPSEETATSNPIEPPGIPSAFTKAFEAKTTDELPEHIRVIRKAFTPPGQPISQEKPAHTTPAEEAFLKEIADEIIFQRKYGVEIIPREKKVSIPRYIPDEQLALCVGTKDVPYSIEREGGERVHLVGPATAAAQVRLDHALEYLLDYAIVTKHLNHEERRIWLERFRQDETFKKALDERNQVRVNKIAGVIGDVDMFATLVKKHFSSNEHPFYLQLKQIFREMRDRIYIGDGLPLEVVDQTHSQLAYDRMSNERKVQTVEFIEDKLAEFLNTVAAFSPDGIPKEYKTATIRVTGAARHNASAAIPGSVSPDKNVSIAPPPIDAKENLSSN